VIPESPERAGVTVPVVDRAEVSRRLKAARWLVGRLDRKGRPTPLPISELALHPSLEKNRITPNRLEEIEQMKTEVRTVELLALADALGLPTWFDGVADPKPESVAALWRQALDEADRARRQAEEAARRESDDMDHRGEAPGDGGA
jgi:hypothetical protein